MAKRAGDTMTTDERRQIEQSPGDEAAFPVRRIELRDLRLVLEKGLDDFRTIPTHAFFVGIVYAVLGLVIIRWSFQYALLPLVYPLIFGFALVGPFAALGLYELSRRRERGEEARFWHMFEVRRARNRGAILRLGLGVALAFLVWLWIAVALVRATFGDLDITLGAFLGQLFTTSHGWTLVIVGNLIGAVFALAILAGTTIAFPMLVDREVDVSTAVATSLRVFAANPGPMVAWGLIVMAALLLGALPFLLGLLVVLPVLGHATWHLYRRTVA
jgi:uncharacterized membrane protein